MNFRSFLRARIAAGAARKMFAPVADHALPLSITAFFLLISIPLTDAHYLVRRVNLEEMTVLADRIFVGRCASVEETEAWVAGGVFPATRYTFEVERAVKGRMPPTITFRHLGYGSRPVSGKGGEITARTFLNPMSTYRVGDRLLLFLNAEAPRSRMTSPVGLYQGAFFIRRMPSGEELARNSVHNLGLLSTPYTGVGLNAYEARVVLPEGYQRPAAGVRALARHRAPLPLDQFIGAVEGILAAHGGAKGVITGTEQGRLPN